MEDDLSGHKLKMGIWADGRFSWLGDGWQIETKHMPETRVSRSRAFHPGPEIQIETNDAMHCAHDGLFTVWSDVEVQNL